MNGHGMSGEASEYTYHEVTTWGEKRKQRALRSFLDRVVPPLSKGARVVEIGPGRGELGRITISRGDEYTAIEPSTTLAAKLEEAGINVIRSEVPPLPVEDVSCELVISFDVFEHFQSYREAMSVCRESYRALTPGGYLTIVAPNYDTLHSLFYLYEYQHGFVTNRCRLEGLARDAGFEVVRSSAFLTSLGYSPWWPLDRLLAHLTLPILRSSLLIALFRGLGLETTLFRLHKNFCDHIAVVGRKPSG